VVTDTVPSTSSDLWNDARPHPGVLLVDLAFHDFSDVEGASAPTTCPLVGASARTRIDRDGPQGFLKAQPPSAAATAAASPRRSRRFRRRGAPAAARPGVAARVGRRRHLGQGPLPLLRHRLPRAGGRPRGRVVAIAGDQLAPVNRGLLCVKGYHVGLALYGSDRLTGRCSSATDATCPSPGTRPSTSSPTAHPRRTPRLRVLRLGPVDHPRGLRGAEVHEGGPREQPHRPQRAALHGLRGHGVHSAPSASTSPTTASTTSTHADVVILWGNNMAEMHPVLFSRLMDRRSRGERFTLIDIDHAAHPHHGLRRPRAWSSSRTATSRSPTASPTCSSRQAPTTATSSSASATSARTPRSPDLNGEADDLRGVPRASRPTRPSTSRALGRARGRNPHARAALRRPQQEDRLALVHGVNQHTRGTAINRIVHGSTCSRGTSAARRRAAEPHRAALGLRHRARGRDHRAPAPGRTAGRQPRAPPRSRGDLEPPVRPHQRHARLPHGRDVEALQHATARAATSTPSGCRSPTRGSRCPTSTSSSRRRDAWRTSSSSCRTCTRRPPRARRPHPPLRDVGREERHGRQLRAPHAAVVQDGRSPGEARDDVWQTIAVARASSTSASPACATRTASSSSA
jgi:hypothetical protein